MSATEATAVIPAPPEEAPARSDPDDWGSAGRRRWWTGAGVAASYLALSVLVWWGVWSTHPTSTTTCGCGDTSLFTWFLAWPAHALTHGLDPFYSTAAAHPGGVNLLANTSVVGLGLVLAPVTWAFGPIATLNVALTLAPALSAVTMYVLCRRWVQWRPAAWIGGLLYGFSPFILVTLTDAHLMLAFAPVPPLLVLCADEALVRQRWRPRTVGLLVGGLALVQLLVGTEVLVISAVGLAVGVALVVAHRLVRRRATAAWAGYAGRCAAWGAGSVAVLLAWPAWFSLAGPAHFSGRIWGPDVLLSFGGTATHYLLFPTPASASATAIGHRLGGYQAPTLAGQYFGTGLLAVLVAGLVVWRRDGRLWVLAGVGAVATAFSTGLSYHGGWSPWRLMVDLPQMDNVIPSRFLVVMYLCAAGMLALVVDHTRRSVGARMTGPGTARDGAPPSSRARAVGAVAALAVAAVGVVPIATYFAPGLPLTVVPVVVPPWFRQVAPHLGSHQVLLVLPPPFSLRESALTWQAVSGTGAAQVGVSGPGSLLARAGREQAGQSVLDRYTNATVSPGVEPGDVAAVRHALAGWGVTTVVVPDPSRLPEYDRLDDLRATLVLVTAALGRPPVRRADAWVWTDVRTAGPPSDRDAAALNACASGPPAGSLPSLRASVRCALG